jgi:hypothetical protein
MHSAIGPIAFGRIRRFAALACGLPLLLAPTGAALAQTAPFSGTAQLAFFRPSAASAAPASRAAPDARHQP